MHFERVLKQRHVLALAFGAMVGWSWVLLSGMWIERAGTLGAVLAFLIAGGAMIFIALTYAELAAAMPETGGEHVYTERAFGRGLSFVCTWALLLGYVSVVAFEVVALPIAVSYLWPALNVGLLWQVAAWDVYAGHIALGIAGALVLTIVNVRGIAAAASLQGFVTLLIVCSGLLLATGALEHGRLANLQPLFVDGWRGVFAVLVMVPLMFVGFDVIPQAAEEIDLPPARIGAVMIVAVACGIAWYAGIILAVGYVLPSAARASATLATADAASLAWSGSWAGALLLGGGIAGIITTWNAFLVGASRLTYVLAADGLLPAWLAPRGRDAHGLTPALWTICALSCLAPWFGRPVLVWLIDTGSFGVVIAYAIVALAFVRLRQREPAMPRPYRVPGGATCGWLAFILSLLLAALYLPPSPGALIWPQEWILCGAWAVAGIALYRRAATAFHAHT